MCCRRWLRFFSEFALASASAKTVSRRRVLNADTDVSTVCAEDAGNIVNLSEEAVLLRREMWITLAAISESLIIK